MEGSNPAMAPFGLAIDLDPSNEEINVRYWETYKISLSSSECLGRPDDAGAPLTERFGSATGYRIALRVRFSVLDLSGELRERGQREG